MSTYKFHMVICDSLDFALLLLVSDPEFALPFLLPHIMAENVLSLHVFMFRIMDLAVILVVNVVHLIHQVLSIRHKLTHGI